MPANRGGGAGTDARRPPHAPDAEVAAAAAAAPTPAAQPSTPTRTPSKPTSGMVLRSGFTPGSRTPRSRRPGGVTDASTDFSLFGNDFGSDDLLRHMDLVNAGEPELLENFMVDFAGIHDENPLYFGGSPRQSPRRSNIAMHHAAAAHAAAAAQAQNGSSHHGGGHPPHLAPHITGVHAHDGGNLQGQQFTGAGLSPVTSGKLMSPGIELARLRRPSGYTPQLARGQPSPRLGPFPSPRPSTYHLRSASQSPAAGLTAKHPDVTPFGLVDGGFVSDAYFDKPHSSAKRPLLTEAQLQLFTSPGPGHKKTGYDGERTGGKSGSSTKKPRRDKKDKADRRTATAPKRGEYRCGKCGFFPKKAKHNCSVEKAKRQAAGAAAASAAGGVPGAVGAAGGLVGGSGGTGGKKVNGNGVLGGPHATMAHMTSGDLVGDDHKQGAHPKVTDPVLSAYNTGQW
eukprot:m.229898 g.229898  ORF g.229898 m.229898 type:complete len:454 (+) comp18853_c0_seq3:493-1854(+)